VVGVENHRSIRLRMLLWLTWRMIAEVLPSRASINLTLRFVLRHSGPLFAISLLSASIFRIFDTIPGLIDQYCL